MTYEEGKEHMINLSNSLKEGEEKDFFVGKLRINYPGKKQNGDYKLYLGESAPKHFFVIEGIYNMTTEDNFKELTLALEDIYSNGLNTSQTYFSKGKQELLFWITLQEDINYPPPRYAGRKLPFQRFFEGALAKLNYITLEEVENRANNRARGIPKLLEVDLDFIPSFYR